MRGTITPVATGDNVFRDRGDESRERLLYGRGWFPWPSPAPVALPCSEVGSLRILPHVIEHARLRYGTGFDLADALPRHAPTGAVDILHESRFLCTSLRIEPEVVVPLQELRVWTGPLPPIEWPADPVRLPEPPLPHESPEAPAPAERPPVLMRKGAVSPADWMFRDDPVEAIASSSEAPAPGFTQKLTGFASRFERGQDRLAAAFAELPPTEPARSLRDIQAEADRS